MKPCKKIVYPTRRKAWIQALLFKKVHNWDQYAYKCPKCSKFHLTRKYVVERPAWFAKKLRVSLWGKVAEYFKTIF